MKKKIALILSLIMLITALTACRNNPDNSEAGDNKPVNNSSQGKNQDNETDDAKGDNEDNADTDTEGNTDESNDYSEQEPVKRLAELASGNEFIDGVMLREKMTFSCVEELAAKTSFSAEDMIKLDPNIYIDQTENVSLSSYEQIPDAFGYANDLYDSYNPGPFQIITITNDMTLDGNLIVNDSGYRTNPKTTLRYGMLVVPSGVTLTLTNDIVLSLSDMASGYSFLWIQEGGSLVVEHGEIHSYKGIYMDKGGSMTIKKGHVETNNFVSNGAVTISAADMETYTALAVGTKFFNGASGTITVQNKGKLHLTPPSGGIYSVPYSSDDYGSEDYAKMTFEHAMGVNAPFGYNKGKITISDGGLLEGNSTDIGSEGMPFINDGEIVLVAKGEPAADLNDFHFQNYGTLNLQGENNGDTGRNSVLYAFSSFIENYGTISFEQKKGYGIHLYTQSNDLESGRTYFINYSGGILQEKNTALQSLYLESYSMFFDNVKTTNQIATKDPALSEMTARENWEGTFFTNEQNPVFKENYVKIGFNSGDEMSFYFSYGNGEDRFNCYADFLLTSVSDYSAKMTASSSDYPGEYPVTIQISKDFQNLTYTVENTKYGTLTQTVPRKN